MPSTICLLPKVLLDLQTEWSLATKRTSSQFLEAMTKEIEIFQHSELRFFVQIRKRRDGCLVEFCQISKSNGERIRLRKYKVQDFEELSSMKHDLLDLKMDFARKHFEDKTPSLETQLQTDTLQTDI